MARISEHNSFSTNFLNETKNFIQTKIINFLSQSIADQSINQ